MRKKYEKMRKSGPRPPQKMSNKVIPDPGIFPSCVQDASKRSKRRPRGAQDAPRASQERSKSGQERPQTTQERPKSCQERPQSDRNLPEGRPMCQQRHVFCPFLCFLLVCNILFLAFAAFFCGCFLFFASLRVNVTRHRIWGGASNRGLPLTCGLDPSQS